MKLLYSYVMCKTKANNFNLKRKRKKLQFDIYDI